MDEDGFIYIKGRIKRMIIRFDGHKVFPAYVEGVISKHPDVVSSAVVGVKDREHAQGQSVLAVVQLKDKISDQEKVRAEINEQINAEVEKRGIPANMIFVDEMPHTGMGKIDYLKLAKDYDAKLDQGI